VPGTTADGGIAAMTTERLEAEACTMAAQLAAATARFIALIAELDRRETWRSWGCRSTAHWLSWRCALGLHAAREHVRVARALESLPRTSAAFAAGELSYSKVRAITRVATPGAEAELVDVAKLATAAQLDRTVGSYASVVRNLDPDRARMQQQRRTVRVVHNDDGTVTVTARLAPDAAAILLAALDRAGRAVRTEERAPAATLRADALEHLAQAFLQPRPHDAAPTEIVIHADANLSVAVGDDRAIGISIDAVRRLACDTSVRHVRDDAAGARRDSGRRRRTVSRRLRRWLVRRDGDTCRFPGCPARHFLHAHHIEHWADGGATDAANLVLLCSFHHRLVHEESWGIAGDPNTPVGLTFTSPTGRALDEHPRRPLRTDWRIVPLRLRHLDGSAIDTATGEYLDRHHMISSLCCLLPPDRN
jgi:Domain of unknown function (DUF222)/HNH endonuclease